MHANRYSNERGWPATLAGVRSHLRLEFNGGWLRMPGVGKFYSAVSGRLTPDGFRYSVERQRVSNEGPIPEGVYWVAPAELWSNAWYRPASRSAWGNHRLSIHPFPDTETYGRGGFFIHGGATPGSAGCIDLWHQMDRFVADLKAAVNGAERVYCILTVNYNLSHRE